jgi:HK97 family phage major capsid protein
MSYINDLRDLRAKAIADARTLVDKCQAEKRSMSAEEDVNYGKYLEEADRISGQINKLERHEDMERQSAALVAKAAEDRKASGLDKSSDKADIEIRALRDFLMTGDRQQYRSEMRSLKMDSNEAGGFLVAPQQFVNQLIKFVDDEVFIRGLAFVQTIRGAHGIGAPSLDADPEDGTWTSEVGSVDEDTQMDFGNRELVPNQLTKLVKVSQKLMMNSLQPIDTLVASRLAYKIGVTQEKAYMTGTGANQPLGVFTASNNGIPTGQDVSTGNTTTAIGADGLIEAKFKLKGQYQRSGTWIFHRDAIKQISKLKDGEGQYLWRPGLTESTPDMLLGRPVLMSEFAPNTFTTGQYVGIFGDFRQYWIVDSMDFQLQRLNELYAANNQVGFIGRYWGDGMPVLSEAFARVKLA